MTLVRETCVEQVGSKIESRGETMVEMTMRVSDNLALKLRHEQVAADGAGTFIGGIQNSRRADRFRTD